MKKNYIGTYGVIDFEYLMKNKGMINHYLLEDERENEVNLLSKILKCIGEKENNLEVFEIKNNEEKKIYKIKKEVYKKIDRPTFNIGDKVKLFKYPDKKAIVRDIEWHKKDERIIYYLDVEGDKRKSNSMYYQDENKFEKVNE